MARERGAAEVIIFFFVHLIASEVSTYALVTAYESISSGCRMSEWFDSASVTRMSKVPCDRVWRAAPRPFFEPLRFSNFCASSQSSLRGYLAHNRR